MFEYYSIQEYNNTQIDYSGIIHMTQPIKVNHIGDNGKRTTTTISYAICSFYAHQVHRDKLHTTFTYDELRQLVQDFVNSDRKFLTNKFAIENMLLNECFHAIEQRTRETFSPLYRGNHAL